ncbi:titin-like isoform X5 [Bolinopsis microptera]|uniref:titin-like isoform X5 n=1 Tax=Bolinopsis microptera TaxID=2820187 RepID=UPI00307991D9
MEDPVINDVHHDFDAGKIDAPTPGKASPSGKITAEKVISPEEIATPVFGSDAIPLLKPSYSETLIGPGKKLATPGKASPPEKIAIPTTSEKAMPPKEIAAPVFGPNDKPLFKLFETETLTGPERKIAAPRIASPLEEIWSPVFGPDPKALLKPFKTESVKGPEKKIAAIEKTSSPEKMSASEKASPTKEIVAPDAKPLSKPSETVKGPEKKIAAPEKASPIKESVAPDAKPLSKPLQPEALKGPEKKMSAPEKASPTKEIVAPDAKPLSKPSETVKGPENKIAAPEKASPTKESVAPDAKPLSKPLQPETLKGPEKKIAAIEKTSSPEKIAAIEKASPTKESVAPDAKPLSKPSENVKGPENKIAAPEKASPIKESVAPDAKPLSKPLQPETLKGPEKKIAAIEKTSSPEKIAAIEKAILTKESVAPDAKPLSKPSENVKGPENKIAAPEKASPIKESVAPDAKPLSKPLQPETLKGPEKKIAAIEKTSSPEKIAAIEKASPTKESVAPDAKPLSKPSENVKGPENKIAAPEKASPIKESVAPYAKPLSKPLKPEALKGPENLPKVEDAPDSQEGAASTSSSDEPNDLSPNDHVPDSPGDDKHEELEPDIACNDQAADSPDDHGPDSPVDDAPDSPVETNDVDVHLERESTMSEEDAADAMDRQVSDPVYMQDDDLEPEQAEHEAEDKNAVPQEEDNVNDKVQTQLSFESSNQDETDPEEADSPMEANSFDQIGSEESKEPAPEIVSPPEDIAAPENAGPPKEIAAPVVVSGAEPLSKPIETQTVKGPEKSEKIKELEDKISQLECSLKSKDDTITSLQSEVQRLNTEIKSRSGSVGSSISCSEPNSKPNSVPSKKPASAISDPKSKSVGAKKTRPASAARAVAKPSPVSNGVAKKPAGSPTKKPGSATTRARPVSAAPKAAPGGKSSVGKKFSPRRAGKGGNRVEMTKGLDGANGRKNLSWVDLGTMGEKEHAVKLMLRGRGIVCYPPTDFSLDGISSEKPDETLKINWVYGYRGRDSQDNIYSLPSNELLYYQAAVGVIYNPATKTQRFYQGHNDDIKSIALNPANPSIVATGQAAGHDEKEGDPHVRVWNCETFETLAVLGLGNLQRGVGSVSFSPDGSKVLAVDEGNDHTIFIYDIKKKVSVASQKGHQDPVLGAEYIPGQNNKFITYGKGHIIFWEQDGNKLVKKSGLFEKHPKPRFITALAFTAAGEPITGDSNGNLFLWNPNERKISKQKVGAHEGSVYSVAVKGDEIYTGGQDCKVKKFSCSDLAEVDSWQLDSATHGRVRAIAFVGEDLAVGTYNNGMLYGKFGDAPEQIIYGHGAGDLWGGANHPLENSFATVGQDKVVYIWDAESHTPKQVFKVEKPAQACCFSPDGSVLAVASTTGEWWVLDSKNGLVLSSYKSGPEQIDAMSYSPDGKSIAVGSHDNYVYLFECGDIRAEYKAIGKCAGHSSFITHLDFSDDGKVLQTTSGDYEHLFWDATSGDQITSTKDMRDVNMSSYTCTLGFPVCGIWPVGYDGTDINALCRSHNDKLVVTADDFGLVNLFRFPCCNPTAEWSSFRGHSAHVTKVRFLLGDKEIFSLGGRDQSIIQWGVC